MTQPTLTLDPNNANRGTVRGRGMLEHSLRQFGAGRAPVVTADGVVIAGNKTVETAQELGIPVQEIESDGRTLFVIKRTDLPYDDPRAKELAIADNRTGEVGLEWDAEMLAELADEGIDLDQFWLDEELAELLGSEDDADESDPAAYTADTPSPVYTPTGEEPDVDQLLDTSRRDQLRRDIQAADIPEDVRAFLLAAAERHTVFDYRRIAEFYAHADPQVQRLMEDSALVIIDFNRAIELGYVRLSSRLEGVLEGAIAHE